jgi:hypothetical protein
MRGYDSEAGGDLSLFNLGATDSRRSSGAADSRLGGPRAAAHGCRVGEVVLRHRPPLDRPERLLRATLLMILYSIRSERQLMEQMNDNLLFRWFVGLEMDDAIWDVTVFTKNCERWIAGAISQRKRKLIEKAFGWANLGRVFTLPMI